jgi:two-component system, cell cycle response regulator DivK
LSGPLIMIIEDDPNSRKLVRDVLEHHGFRTVIADCAEDGLHLIEQHLPALILMDIHLPGMSGIDAIRELRGTPRTSRIPVVAVTASVLSEQQEHVMRAGFDAFEPKPLVLKGFVARLQRLLDAARTQGES